MSYLASPLNLYVGMWYLCVFVYILVCLSVSTHVPYCTCKGKRTTSGSDAHLCLSARSLLFAAMYIRLAGPWATRDSPVSASQIPGRMMDYSNGHHNVCVLHGFWDWNSDTHTNMANVLPSDSSLQTWSLCIFWISCAVWI